MLFENVGIVFSGQGSQFEGMGKELINREEYKTLEKIDKEISEMVNGAEKVHLDKTSIAQPAIFLQSITLFKELSRKDAEFKHYSGLSLGEYTALCAAGKIDFEESLNLVCKRGKIMEEGIQGKGAMLAVLKSDVNEVQDIIDTVKGDEILSISNLNSPGQIVVGGSNKAIEAFEKEGTNRKIKRIVRLNVQGPFHTEFLKESADKFESQLKKIQFIENENEVYSNYKVKKHNKDNFVENLKNQMFSTVEFENCVRKMIDNGCDTFIEIGPAKTLSGFIKKIDRGAIVYNIEKLEDVDVVYNCLKG